MITNYPDNIHIADVTSDPVVILTTDLRQKRIELLMNIIGEDFTPTVSTTSP